MNWFNTLNDYYHNDDTDGDTGFFHEGFFQEGFFLRRFLPRGLFLWGLFPRGLYTKALHEVFTRGFFSHDTHEAYETDEAPPRPPRPTRLMRPTRLFDGAILPSKTGCSRRRYRKIRTSAWSDVRCSTPTKKRHFVSSRSENWNVHILERNYECPFFWLFSCLKTVVHRRIQTLM